MLAAHSLATERFVIVLPSLSVSVRLHCMGLPMHTPLLPAAVPLIGPTALNNRKIMATARSILNDRNR